MQLFCYTTVFVVQGQGGMFLWSTKKTARGTAVREVLFAFPSDFHARWRPDDPA
jgi:hypothetical protein